MNIGCINLDYTKVLVNARGEIKIGISYTYLYLGTILTFLTAGIGEALFSATSTEVNARYNIRQLKHIIIEIKDPSSQSLNTDMLAVK